MASSALDAPAPAAAFSASDAALDGFRVIRRHWRLVVGWGVFNLLAVVALVVVSVIMLLTLGASGVSAKAAGAVSGLIGFLGMFPIEAMVVTALYRTLLRAEEPGFLHLRLGGDEARLLVVWAVLGGGAFLWIGLAWDLTAFVQRQWGTPPAVLAGFAWLGGLVYLTMRFCLAAPATFAAGRLRIASSWKLTRGRSAPLLGMGVLALCLLAMIAVVGWFVLWLLVGAVSGFHDLGLSSLSDEDSITSRPMAALVQIVGEILYAPVLWAISQAPLVAAYRALVQAED